MVLSSLKKRLARTHNALVGGVSSALGKKSRAEALEEIEETLIMADVGVLSSQEIVASLMDDFGSFDEGALLARLRAALYDTVKGAEARLSIDEEKKPYVIMVLGVNGVGKTTTIGKLASRFTGEGRSVILGAADTFRAAAVEQLEVWGERTGATVIKQTHGTDPGAVAYDALQAAIARKADVLLLDTAGRLHTKTHLMDELVKIDRVISKVQPGAPHERLLVLDASTGQNALNQARLFDEAVGVTGLALTKLDGTARGGVIIPVARELSIPIRLIGVGEGVEDLRDFDAREFADALV